MVLEERSDHCNCSGVALFLKINTPSQTSKHDAKELDKGTGIHSEKLTVHIWMWRTVGKREVWEGMGIDGRRVDKAAVHGTINKSLMCFGSLTMPWLWSLPFPSLTQGWIPGDVAFPCSCGASRHSASFFFSSTIKSHSGWTFPATCREESFGGLVGRGWMGSHQGLSPEPLLHLTGLV